MRGLRRLLRYQRNLDHSLTTTVPYFEAELRLYLDRPGLGQVYYYHPTPMTLQNGEVVYVRLPSHWRQLTDENREDAGNAEVLSINYALLLVMSFVGERYSRENYYYDMEKSTIEKNWYDQTSLGSSNVSA